jgi:hypothetical protein
MALLAVKTKHVSTDPKDSGNEAKVISKRESNIPESTDTDEALIEKAFGIFMPDDTSDWPDEVLWNKKK